jgi:hypothetical protein
LFSAFGVMLMIRFTRVVTLVVGLSLFAIPLLGWATYAVWPRPLGSFDSIRVGLPFAGFAAALIVAGVVLRIAAWHATTFASILRQAPLTLIAWPCMVVAIASLVAPFEPGFAVGDVAATGIWYLVWIPRPLRRLATRTSYEVAAPPERVFAFITDPFNWPRYRGDIDSVDVRPAGPVVVGSEIRTRRRLDLRGLRGPRMLVPTLVETVEVVTQLVPGALVASRRTDGVDSEASASVTAIDGGTAVTGAATIVVPYRLALVGGVIEARTGMPRALAKARESQDRLRKLIEESPAAQ